MSASAPANAVPSGPLRFGAIELHPGSRELRRDGQEVPLGARAFDLLLVLIECRDRLVTKSELLERVWPGLVVEENNLQVQVSALRKVLGPAAIATVPGRGYRFALPLAEAATPVPAERPAAQSGVLWGREADLAALRDLVPRHPLVAIVGPGGIGKTRVALALVEALRADFDEAIVVELAPIADPGHVVPAIARALAQAAGDPNLPFEQAVQAWAGRRVLLLLENCEHVLAAVDNAVAALRTQGPDLRILATSQEVLRHPDEQVYRLGSLELPAESTVAAARASGAVELFVARTRAVTPRFALGDDNVAAVVEVCRRLDGIPLAIELAAARVPLLGVEGVRDRLDERFRILTAGSRVALRRHQTLRAALEWSCGLLTEPERVVFERLAVFAGGFSLECAQRLAADDAMDEWSVLDHLGALVDKSLVSVDDGHPPRYRMLETARAYAWEGLAERGATACVIRRHAEVMLEEFERFHRELRQGAVPQKVGQHLVADFDNFRNALRWASAADGDRMLALALFGAAGSFGGYLKAVVMAPADEVDHWIRALRPLADGTVPGLVAARFWLACAEFEFPSGPALAVEDARRALELFREGGDRMGMWFAADIVACAHGFAGALDEARRALQESRALLEPDWPPWLRGAADETAAWLLGAMGEFADARRHAAAYLQVSRELGSAVDVCSALSHVIRIELAAGAIADAVAAAEQMLAVFRSLPPRLVPWDTLRSVATAFLLGTRLDDAEAAYREALASERRRLGAGAAVLYEAATLIALRGRLDDAARIQSYADRFYEETGRRPNRVALGLREALLARLAAERTPEQVERLFAQGRRLTGDAACALAFPENAG